MGKTRILAGSLSINLKSFNALFFNMHISKPLQLESRNQMKKFQKKNILKERSQDSLLIFISQFYFSYSKNSHLVQYFPMVPDMICSLDFISQKTFFNWMMTVEFYWLALWDSRRFFSEGRFFLYWILESLKEDLFNVTKIYLNTRACNSTPQA